ncbi:uncharacterized protein A1O9_11843 [Exophiala aquamarina CBS 119918]|uniref:Transcription factor TFIIIC triple barrel domain-containing protein n=1 Tax=Exophiala aquamarina CBS 119918 TaxID=1182545 RepID=A0A072NXA9_9EURO|nr:uncharacterized protein A1O9_11843 [Exophiala aquamarina CBS 119918]KEF52216.1 hypothetical protein A1O9_11843 [Exophiala aquamarina CBS 119918]
MNNSDTVFIEDENENEYEYEYEYDENETEAFLVDLDLSSLNHTVVRPNISGASAGAGAHKPNKTSNSKGKGSISATHSPDPDAEEVSSATARPQIEDGDGSVSPEPQTQQPTPTPGQEGTAEPEQDDTDLNAPSNVQVLDLHTSNPIISYQDQVYSCSWVDMIGTNMFFTQPGVSGDIVQPPLLSTDDFDLLGTSTIKLLGYRAHMKKSSKKRARPEDAETQQQAPEGRSLGTLTRSNPKKNAQIKRQATFLEKLMEIKDRRGHQDSVRTYVDEKIASQELSKLSETQRTEMDALNRRVVRGDADALERLEKIYSQLDDVAGDFSGDNAMEPQPQPQRQLREPDPDPDPDPKRGDGPGGLPDPENMQTT